MSYRSHVRRNLVERSGGRSPLGKQGFWGSARPSKGVDGRGGSVTKSPCSHTGRSWSSSVSEEHRNSYVRMFGEPPPSGEEAEPQRVQRSDKSPYPGGYMENLQFKPTHVDTTNPQLFMVNVSNLWYVFVF